MIPLHLNLPGSTLVIHIADVSPPPADPTKAAEALTSAMTGLTQQLNVLRFPGEGWVQPATHFVDTLPLYNPLTLSMILMVCLIFGGCLMFIWSQYRKNKHQQDMVKAMSVPIDAFTSMVQQQATSMELLGRRIETMGDQFGSVTDSVSRLGQVIDGIADRFIEYQEKSNNIQNDALRRHQG